MKYIALETDTVRRWQAGTPDANDQNPEHAISDGHGSPCRHCLSDIPTGAGMLVLAHRPFASLHPYAETGPIFVCADRCERAGNDHMPDILTISPDYLIKGYGDDDRIVYGTGAVVPSTDIDTHCAALLQNPKIAYLHARSARNNCYLLRIDR